jgi:hypothetical protein
MLKAQSYVSRPELPDLVARPLIRRHQVDWQLVDWSRSDEEISGSTGASMKRVALARPRKTAERSPRRASMEANWSRVDWRLDVATIAYSLRLSVRQVRRMKKKLGKNEKK